MVEVHPSFGSTCDMLVKVVIDLPSLNVPTSSAALLGLFRSGLE